MDLDLILMSLYKTLHKINIIISTAVMSEAINILDEIVKAKECIKRKYIALKTGADNVQQLMTQTFNPIIKPLTEISNKHGLTSNNENKIENKKSKQSFEDDYQQEIENWFQSTDLDKIYGPKKLPNGLYILGGAHTKAVRRSRSAWTCTASAPQKCAKTHQRCAVDVRRYH